MKLSGIVLLLVIFQTFSPSSQWYFCSTPKDWLYKTKYGGYYLPTGKGGKWPHGVVKYHLNSSLTEQDKQVVYQAIEEYHSKTCIRFQRKSEQDENYVSIERDDRLYSQAHVCMMGGYQYVRIGRDSGNKANMIHQLGHALCLPHEEESRFQGDKYILAHEQCPNILNISSNPLEHRLYDIASQMHVDCGTEEKKCGFQVTPGLSMLDAEYINDLYNCQGCNRHRWVPKRSLLLERYRDGLYHFGFSDVGENIYPCRAYFKGAVSIGKYRLKENTCYIGVAGKEYKLCEQFVVLTIPQGMRASDSEYGLVETNTGMTVEEQTSVLQNAVIAGRLPWTDGTYSELYVALGAVPNFQKSCDIENVNWKGGANKKVDVIGRMWQHQNGIQAYAAFCKLDFHLPIFYVLTCKKTNTKIHLQELTKTNTTKSSRNLAVKIKQDGNDGTWITLY